MSQLTRDDVARLGFLARLKLTDEELDKFAIELSKILEYVELLNEADVSGLNPTLQVTGLTNVMRDDEVIDYKIKDLLRNSKEQVDGQVKVRKMI